VGQQVKDEAEDLKLGGMDIFLARDTLDGKVMIGQKVLVIGGGSVGSETADYIAGSYREVTIIEMRDEIALDEEGVPRMFLLERLSKNSIQFVTGAVVKRFTKSGVIYEKDGIEQALEDFDTAILALGTRGHNPLGEKVNGKVNEVYVLGDASKARKAYEAIDEAAEIALKI
jgi:pyruvate/2-oxoglutarate dehydrogenase complex dihydrolipoamide dehydrogenase (E3) component